jgi:hypothetical protein
LTYKVALRKTVHARYDVRIPGKPYKDNFDDDMHFGPIRDGNRAIAYQASLDRIGDSESELADATDEHDERVADDDREGVDATDMDVDKEKDEGGGKDSRC